LFIFELDFSNEYIQKFVDKGRENKNKFVSIIENKIDTITFKNILVSLQRIRVIIDREYKSATEQFLMLVKQSKKTTIYGYENNGKVLDYAYLNVVFSPSKYW